MMDREEPHQIDLEELIAQERATDEIPDLHDSRLVSDTNDNGVHRRDNSGPGNAGAGDATSSGLAAVRDDGNTAGATCDPGLIAHAKEGAPPQTPNRKPFTPRIIESVQTAVSPEAVDECIADNSEESTKEQPVFEQLPPNVELIPCHTTEDIPVARILQDAMDTGLQEIVIVGLTDSNKEYVASNTADLAITIYHLTRALHRLHNIADSIFNVDTNVRPKT